VKRRGFIASLVALPAGLMAAAKVCAQPVGVDWDAIIDAGIKRAMENIVKSQAEYMKRTYGVTIK
jgi:hypothetical protein